MRVSKNRLKNKQTILTAAGRLFRERGFDAVTVNRYYEISRSDPRRIHGYSNRRMT